MSIPPKLIHESGDGVLVPRHVAQAAAWRVAAELIRRHSDDLYAIELHPGMGQHHQLALYVREGSEIARPGSIFRLGVSRGGRLNGRSLTEKGYTRFHWIDVLFALNLNREIIHELEMGEDLPSPPVSPPLNQKSIGAYVIATALAMRMLSARPLEANNGVYDSSGLEGSAVCTEYFKEFDSMIDEIAGHENHDNLREHPAYRFWFLGTAYMSYDAPPILGIDTGTGRVWGKSVTAGDLMTMYHRSNSDIYRLISELIPAGEMEKVQ